MAKKHDQGVPKVSQLPVRILVISFLHLFSAFRFQAPMLSGKTTLAKPFGYQGVRGLAGRA